MFTHDDILTPLAITVIIDTKVRDPEIEAFVLQALALIELFEIDPMNPTELKKWFAANRDKISDTLNGPRRNTMVLRALSKFKDEVHMENMYDAMVQISLSDDEYRAEESDLVKSAASLWGYNRPPIKVMR